MDNGLLLGISQCMPIDFRGLTLDELKAVKAARPERKPSGGWQDALEELALRSQEELKLCGDHIILPLIVRDIAGKCFAFQNGKLYYRKNVNEQFRVADGSEYDSQGERII